LEEAVKEDVVWFGYAHYIYDEETRLPQDLKLFVRRSFLNPITGKCDLPIRLGYSSIFIVRLSDGFVVKDKYGRQGKKATPFELELFRNIKEKEDRIIGAGI
jgi:hypothetical protein